MGIPVLNREILVHILCCYWLPERPIGILVLNRELLHKASTSVCVLTPMLLLAA
jgi:hypothetical protein